MKDIVTDKYLQKVFLGRTNYKYVLNPIGDKDILIINHSSKQYTFLEFGDDLMMFYKQDDFNFKNIYR